MAPNLTVYVKKISAQTKEQQIKEFFSFCGKISDIKVSQAEDGTQDATVTFEKETAAKTAQLLNNTELDGSQISVTAADGQADDGAPHAGSADRDTDHITQEEKPRSRILAEYLAHGYVIGDAAIERAIELDQKHGVSTRFMNTLTQLDQKFHATDRAKAADQSYGITNRANSLFGGLTSYFEKASNTPTGKRLVKFYTDSQRQAQDIHVEAQRLKELKKEEHGGSAYKASGLERVFGKEKEKEKTEAGASQPGESMSAGQLLSSVVNESGDHTCNCRGLGEVCLCPPQRCICDGCSRPRSRGFEDNITSTFRRVLQSIFPSQAPRI
ncbi:hypothetical protein F5Y09DRAFT_321577 [Xylaria sp. FL1042]|nr:hypothetical protein F5Y09DRAFT_321577 [Xylaria sp. FL1042]